MEIRFGRHLVDTKGKTEAEIDAAIQAAADAALETQEEDSKVFRRRQRRLLKAYELRYEMSSAEMYNQFDSDDLPETGDLCFWLTIWRTLYPHSHKTLTTGTHSKTTVTSISSI